VALDLLLFVLGLAALYFGSEWLVDGAGRLAAAYGISSFVVGLTLIAFGTSAPELVVSSIAAVRGNGALATGNVVGSNIANIALILGVAALIRPIAVHGGLLARDVPVMIGFAILFQVMGWGGQITRPEGVLLLVLFVGYMLWVGRDAHRDARDTRDEREALPPTPGKGRLVLLSLLGLVVLLVGAQLLVTSSVSIARSVGVSEVIIGLTLVAIGTSIPELAASVAAARRRQGQIIIGNIVGSNIFNISLIVGTASVLRPLPVEPEVAWFEVPIMVALCLLMLPLVFTHLSLRRWEGGLLLTGYVAFLVWTVRGVGGI
jgi:cation:H+ antiporter